MLTTLRLSFRDAVRAIQRSPAISALAVTILTLSTAAGAVTFAVVDATVLRPLPYHDSHALVSVFGATARDPRSPHVAVVDYDAWRQRAESFDSLAAWRGWPFQMAHGDSREDVTMVIATASLFEVLHARPLIGTLFGEEHETPGRDGVAVISHALWQRHFGGDPGALGRTLETPRGEVTIVGVMPAEFGFPVESTVPPALWRPLAPKPEERVLDTGRVSYLRVIGRLRQGVSLETARTEIEGISRSIAAEHPQLYTDWRPRVEFTLDAMTEHVSGWMRTVLAAVALLLVIGCANVANLMLTKVSRRSRDVSIRASLGASRGQIGAALLTESALLAILAVGCGVLVAHALLGLVTSALPAGIPRAQAIGLDVRVLMVAALASALTTLVVGLVPAWMASRVPIATSVREASGGAIGGSRRIWQNALLVTQVMLVTALLVGATLLIGSFVQVLRVDLGFASENLVGARLQPAGQKEGGRETVRSLYVTAEDQVRSIPGVASVALALAGPLQSGGYSTTRLSAPGAPASDGVSTSMHRVSPAYFETARIPILHGRGLEEGDRGSRIVVLDELAARRLFGAPDPLGERIALPGLPEHTIVGVVSNVRQLGPEGAALPQIYLLLPDAPAGTVTMLIRTSVKASTVIPTIEARLGSLMPPGSGRVRLEIFDDQLRMLTADRRFSAGLMSALGMLALVIGIGGVYATTAAMVAQRTKEIGIRMALGASARRVVRHVTGRTARLLAIGAALGLAAAWSLSSTLGSVVFGLGSTDPVVYIIPVVLIATGGCLAALLPAVRASRIDPLVTLRTE